MTLADEMIMQVVGFILGVCEGMSLVHYAISILLYSSLGKSWPVTLLPLLVIS